MKDLNDLFQDTVRDIYDSEKRLLEAMPQLMQAAHSERLKEAIRLHIDQSKEQVKRVEQACATLGIDPNGVVCQGTVGLIKECQEHLQEFGGSPAGDAAIIACAQKNEHYEIANYGTAITWAQLLGYDQVVELFELTLNEEEETDDLLTQIAENEVNEKAALAARAGGSDKASVM
jgi:ferritin-like metal-binding protein YciE